MNVTGNEIKTIIILRNDSTSEWLTHKDRVLERGEVGIEFLTNGKAKMKIGDGSTAWENLPYFGGEDAHVYEATVAKGGNHTAAITDTLNGVEPTTHDVAIVKEALIADDKLAEGDTQKYQHTAYRYDGTKWVAFDGNYSADNVYFAEDMMVTKEIGYITITEGAGYIPSAGQNLTGVFEAMFVKETNPSKPSTSNFTTAPYVPYVTVSSNKSTKYEVGTELTGITYSVSFNPGKYQYKPTDTGVVPTKWEITTDKGYSNTIELAEGETSVVSSISSVALDDIVVGDGNTLTITAKATHTAGVTPKTNKGNDCTVADRRISAGTKTKSFSISGWRNYWYGYVKSANESLTGNTVVRDLSTGNVTFNGTQLTAGGTTAKTGRLPGCTDDIANKTGLTAASDDKAFVILVPTSANLKIGNILSFGTLTTSVDEKAFKKYTPPTGATNDQKLMINGVTENTECSYDILMYKPDTFNGATYSYALTNG